MACHTSSPLLEPHPTSAALVTAFELRVQDLGTPLAYPIMQADFKPVDALAPKQPPESLGAWEMSFWFSSPLVWSLESGLG